MFSPRRNDIYSPYKVSLFELIKKMLSRKKYIVWFVDVEKPPIEGDTITVGDLVAEFKSRYPADMERTDKIDISKPNNKYDTRGQGEAHARAVGRFSESLSKRITTNGKED